MNVRIFWSPEYNCTEVAFDTTRKADAVVASLRDDPIPGVEIAAPVPATREECAAVHDPAFVDAVISGEPRSLAGSAGIGWDPDFPVAVLASTGGVRDAVLHALATGGAAGSLSSGLHHARYDRGSGYCTFNGLAVGARAAIAHGATRVVILDLDAHCGGGTAALIRDLPEVSQVDVSVSAFDRYEPRPDARLEIVDGPDYLAAVERALAGIDDPAGIDLLVYNAGMDPHRYAGGVAGIDDDVIDTRERTVFTWAATHGIPVAFVLAGGYTTSMTLSELAALHRRTVEHAAAAFAPDAA
jgi:acetoin utilization deacetylase AcuC-like enzyme